MEWIVPVFLLLILALALLTLTKYYMKDIIPECEICHVMCIQEPREPLTKDDLKTTYWMCPNCGREAKK